MSKAFSLMNNSCLKVIHWASFCHWILGKIPFWQLSFGSSVLWSSTAGRAIPESIASAIQRVPLVFMHPGFHAQRSHFSATMHAGKTARRKREVCLRCCCFSYYAVKKVEYI